METGVQLNLSIYSCSGEGMPNIFDHFSIYELYILALKQCGFADIVQCTMHINELHKIVVQEINARDMK